VQGRKKSSGAFGFSFGYSLYIVRRVEILIDIVQITATNRMFFCHIWRRKQGGASCMRLCDVRSGFLGEFTTACWKTPPGRAAGRETSKGSSGTLQALLRPLP
jgi:hypothetical protein